MQTKRKGRNSNIEVLRLVAMAGITLNHFPWDYLVLGSGDEACLAQFIVNLVSNFGGLGDCLFFGISAWYMSEEGRGGVRRNLKRIFKLEAQLLFYGIALLIITAAIYYAQNVSYSLSDLCHALFSAFFPIASTHWWYPTSYVLFLLFCPFLNVGLRALGKRGHAVLSLVLLALYSLFPYPFLGGVVHFDMSYSVWLFLYQFVVLTCIKWHFPEVLSNRTIGRKLLMLGLALGVGTQVVFGMPLLVAGKSMLSHQLWLNTPACLPSMLMAFGLLVLALTKGPVVSPALNRAASGTLAVYLVLTDNATSQLIGNAVSSLGLFGLKYVVVALVVSVAIFGFCIVADLVRQRILRPVDAAINESADWVIKLLERVVMGFYQKCLLLMR